MKALPTTQLHAPTISSPGRHADDWISQLGHPSLISSRIYFGGHGETDSSDCLNTRSFAVQCAVTQLRMRSREDLINVNTSLIRRIQRAAQCQIYDTTGAKTTDGKWSQGRNDLGPYSVLKLGRQANILDSSKLLVLRSPSIHPRLMNESGCLITDQIERIVG